MKPSIDKIIINNNLTQIEKFVNEIIISPKNALQSWAKITKQTPAAKIGYIGQHLASLITGVPGTGSGARGDDLSDGTEVKSCNKVDQVDKCKVCKSRVMRIEEKCPSCGSTKIDRKDDSKWLFSVRDEFELNQYMNLDRIFLLLMDYPNFDNNDYNDIRIVSFEIYPKEERMKVFRELISNHYYNIYLPKLNENEKTNPMNLHPWSFQFYKCNPIMTFKCIIKDINNKPSIIIDKDNYVNPSEDRDLNYKTIPMPTTLLKDNEWGKMIEMANFEEDLSLLLNQDVMQKNHIKKIDKWTFQSLNIKQKCILLPYIDEKLRNYIPLRPIVSNRQTTHYQRG